MDKVEKGDAGFLASISLNRVKETMSNEKPEDRGHHWIPTATKSLQRSSSVADVEALSSKIGCPQLNYNGRFTPNHSKQPAACKPDSQGLPKCMLVSQGKLVHVPNPGN